MRKYLVKFTDLAKIYIFAVKPGKLAKCEAPLEMSNNAKKSVAHSKYIGGKSARLLAVMIQKFPHQLLAQE